MMPGDFDLLFEAVILLAAHSGRPFPLTDEECSAIEKAYPYLDQEHGARATAFIAAVRDRWPVNMESAFAGLLSNNSEPEA
jgi:hypothetical protein